MSFAEQFMQRQFSRRDALRVGGTAAALVTTAAFLAACGGASGSTEPRPTTTAPMTGLPTPGSTVESEAALLQQIADKFGVGPYAKLGKNWNFVNEGPKNHTVHLNDAPVHTRVNTNGTTIDGYIKVNKPGNPSITLVVNGDAVPQVDLIGGTFRIVDGESADVTRARVWDQVSKKEPIEQPGVIVLPVGFRPEGCAIQSTNVTIKTKGDAAARFGVDNWSINPDNWDVVEYDDSIAFELKVDDSGLTHRVKNLAGTFFEGYEDIKDDGTIKFFTDQGKDVRALTFVGNGSAVTEMDGRGFTIYAPKGETSANELNRRTIHLFADQVVPKELVKQPGTLVLPLGFNPKQVNVC